MIQHGQIGKDEWAHCRWCAVCNQYHGILYRCQYYCEAIISEIAELTNSMDEEWEQKQIDNGIPEEVVEITKILCSKGTGYDR